MFACLLKEKHITQSMLAKEIGVTQQLISKWTKGHCQPQLKQVIQIARILGVSVEDVVKSFEDRESEEEKEECEENRNR